MRKIVLIFSLVLLSLYTYAEQNTSQDTVRTYYIDEIVIISSQKETNSLEKLPGSLSVLSGKQIEAMQVEDIKDVSSIVPNFFIPDYGAKMTSPVYIRGIGNRSAGQATGMYVDHAPFLNKSTFDFDFVDIQQIEILRGPQGTLFGRNSMGGVINIFTPSPLKHQGTKIALSGGNYGFLQAKASNYTCINDNFGFSVGGYYDHKDGYFTNEYSGEKADESDAGGGQLRFDWKINNAFKAYFLTNYDYVDQGAFPYGLYGKSTGKTSPVIYNDEGSYQRNLSNNVLNMEYAGQHFLLSSTTSFQYLKDNMYMDQDFLPESVFTLNQKQKQQTIAQEFSIKSNESNKNYQWSYGVYGFKANLTTDALVEMKEGGLALLQKTFDKIKTNYPNAPAISISDEMVPVPGTYKTPTLGGAIYHQSTYNNLFVDGLSVTAGIRLDYEENKLDYYADGKMNLLLTFPGPVPAAGSTHPLPLDSILSGNESMHALEVLPKISVKYEFDRNNYMYASATKGYNPGGYNIQVFSELTKNALMTQAAKFAPQGTVPINNISVKEATEYDPEYSWNYELGFKGEIIKDIFSATVSLFYIDVDDMQLTKFVPGGEGRMLTNVGKAVNKGFEIEMNAKVTTGLYAGVGYGYTHATFKDYKYENVDYSGKYLPYVPQQTLSVYGSYSKTFKNIWIDKLKIDAQYNAAGKIYWTEANDISQDFYGLLNLKAGVTKKIVTLNIWSKNLLDTDYNAFYFESFGNSFFQRGKPLTFGADLIVAF